MKVLLNVLIIIIILHIILKNLEESFINFNYIFDNNKPIPKDKLSFLLDEDSDDIPSVNAIDPKQDLLNYVNTKLDVNEIKPSNYFNTNDNVPNFKTNVLDIKQDFNTKLDVNEIKPSNYFNTNDNVPNFKTNVLDIKQDFKTIPQKPINLPIMRDNMTLEKDNEIIDKFSGNTIYPAKLKGITDVYSIENVQWKYKDEIPMNGGNFGGITGYDDLDSDYAVYDTSILENSFQSRMDRLNDLDPQQSNDFLNK